MIYYRSTKIAKFVLFFLRKYDWCRLKLQGEKILNQDYLILYSHPHKWNKNKDRFFIFRQIITQSLLDDLTNFKPMDISYELEKKLVEEMSAKN